ncbi:Lrp/AsnC family transcriptional regulator [Nioella nitratireducens]|uniref:Lrp/AsnC family transcriptional regulator n=1 Tax=Nioella nitratireducens TaxID=1287720 RepID=UPI0008FCF1AA|nr:Lrp/AsnC family transcriptional regulator [Nioella nitratireducens]
MDQTDTRILRALQRESNRPVADLAAELGLSASACHRRIKALEGAGIIKGYSARLSRRKLGFNILVFVEITLRSQERSVLEGFEAAVRASPDILECHLTSGQADYTLRVAARDMDDYDRIHRDCLAALPDVSAMHTTFALRPIKFWQGYPVR